MTCTSAMTPNASTSSTPSITSCTTYTLSPSSWHPHLYHWSPELYVVNSCATNRGRSTPKFLCGRGSYSHSSSISRASGCTYEKAWLRGGRSCWILSEWGMHPLKCTSSCSTFSFYSSNCCRKRSHMKSRYSSHRLWSPRFSFHILMFPHHYHARMRTSSQNPRVLSEHT